jgi:hypothetical protein
MQIGQVFYLISMQWWNTWLEYVNAGVSVEIIISCSA